MKFWPPISLVLLLYSGTTLGIISWQEKQDIIGNLSDSKANLVFYEQLQRDYGSTTCEDAMKDKPEVRNYTHYLFKYGIRAEEGGFILAIDENTIMDIYSLIECTIEFLSQVILKMNFVATPLDGEIKPAKYYRIMADGFKDRQAFVTEHYKEIRDMIEISEVNLETVKIWYQSNVKKSKNIKNLCKKWKPNEYNTVIDGKAENKEEMFLALDNASWISLPGILTCTVTRSDKKIKETIYFYMQDSVNNNWTRIYRYDEKRPNHYTLDLSYATFL